MVTELEALKMLPTKLEVGKVNEQLDLYCMGICWTSYGGESHNRSSKEPVCQEPVCQDYVVG